MIVNVSDRQLERSAISAEPVLHVILDRDGVLNEEANDGGYIIDPKQFQWLPGSLDALATFRTFGVRVSVATNQSGIGRGLMTESDLSAVLDKMKLDAEAAQGSIDAVFCCPHAPSAACSCRKPSPGLIEAAIRQSGIPPVNTLVIGDAVRDLDAAHAAGTRAALLRTGKGRRHEALAVTRGIPVFDNLAALAAEVLGSRNEGVDRVESLQEIFAEHVAVVAESAVSILPGLARCITACQRSLRTGGKILACGNGGSAADAQHFVAELVGRYHKARSALPAIALTSDPATFTAISNDFGFEQAFARQIEAFGRPGDVLVAISTSGNSANVIAAARSARERGCTVIALTGCTGGTLAGYAHITLKVPSDVVARIQEVHELCLHAVAQSLDSLELKDAAS